MLTESMLQNIFLFVLFCFGHLWFIPYNKSNRNLSWHLSGIPERSWGKWKLLSQTVNQSFFSPNCIPQPELRGSWIPESLPILKCKLMCLLTFPMIVYYSAFLLLLNQLPHPATLQIQLSSPFLLSLSLYLLLLLNLHPTLYPQIPLLLFERGSGRTQRWAYVFNSPFFTRCPL